MFRFAALTIAVVLLAGLVGVGFMGHAGAAAPPATRPSTTATTKKIVYVCPAHMNLREDSPGKCPRCGAELIPTPE